MKVLIYESCIVVSTAKTIRSVKASFLFAVCDKKCFGLKNV